MIGDKFVVACAIGAIGAFVVACMTDPPKPTTRTDLDVPVGGVINSLGQSCILTPESNESDYCKELREEETK